MKIEDMPHKEIKYWMNRFKRLKSSGFTKQGWCDLGHELMNKHNISERAAVRLLQGDIDAAIDIQNREIAGL